MNPDALFQEIEQFVAQSREWLKHGALTKLEGLDKRILLLCEECIMLSKEDSVRYAQRLQQLMADLTALGEELTTKRDAVGEQLRNIPDVKKAHAAYRVVEVDEEKDD